MRTEKITLKGRHSDLAVWLNGKKLSLKKSLAIVNKSPTGFNWGYAGSGPSQLAFAIALELFDDLKAEHKHAVPIVTAAAIKFNLILKIPQKKDFDLTADLVLNYTTLAGMTDARVEVQNLKFQ